MAEYSTRRAAGKPYKVRLNWVQIVVSVLGLSVCSHILARALRPFLFGETTALHQHQHPTDATTRDGDNNNNSRNEKKQSFNLPGPILHNGKKPPAASYTSQCFDDPHDETSGNTTTWSQHRVDVHLDLGEIQKRIEAREAREEEEDDEDEEEDDEDEEDEDEDEGDEEDEKGPFQPAGQHLLIDIRHVDPTFLLDMERMAKAMVQVITESRLTLLSYHCHDLQPPMGVSCVGVLLESHVSFHTWPSAGVISLDLFTCGSQGLFPLISELGKLFGVPSSAEPDAPPPSMHWSHKMRGYSDYFDSEGNLKLHSQVDANGDNIDSQKYVLGMSTPVYKEVLLLERTKFQQLEILGMPHHSHFHGGPGTDIFWSLANDNKAEDGTNLINKKVFLDGTLQSTRNGVEAYHEALVHPALIAHPNPKRVAIIGGGEGATLREVLKHKTIESCAMIEIDAEFVELARHHLSEWNDCSDFIAPPEALASPHHNRSMEETGSCFDDPRTELFLEDAVSWFTSRYGNKTLIKEEDKLDVIIMDALDPTTVEFSDILYGDEIFIVSLMNSLTDEGILLMQAGEMEGNEMAYQDIGFKNNDPFDLAELNLMNNFERIIREHDAAFEKTYSEEHGEMDGAWSFEITFKGEESKANFFGEAAFINGLLAYRAIDTKSKTFPFKYVDGTTMLQYQCPGRTVEHDFCVNRPGDSKLCERHRGFDPEVPNVPASALEVKSSNIPNAGRGVFFKDSYSKGSYLAIEDNVHAMLVMPDAYDLITHMAKTVKKEWEVLVGYIHGYGFANSFFGSPSAVVDPGLSTFANHGCEGQNNIGTKTSVNEMTADPDNIPDDLFEESDDFDFEHAYYDPYADRNYFHLFTTTKLLKDVSAGDEMLDNYLPFDTEEHWSEAVLRLRAQCLNQELGQVSEYERTGKSKSG